MVAMVTANVAVRRGVERMCSPFHYIHRLRRGVAKRIITKRYKQLGPYWGTRCRDWDN